jgi:lysophospholipase L1-like esterase
MYDGEDAPARHHAATVFLGLFAALGTGLLMLFTIGEGGALLVAAAILAGAIAVSVAAGPTVERVAVVVLGIVLVASIAVIGFGVARILAVISAGTSGPAAPPDPVVLSVAEAKIEASTSQSAFQLELTEAELTAVLQRALASSPSPFRAVTIDITNDVGDPGRIRFDGDFKEGDLGVGGTVGAKVTDGRLSLEVIELDVGMFTVPGVARRAVEDMITSLTDFEAAIAAEGADVQQIVIGNDRLVVTGVHRSDHPVDAATVLSRLGDLPFPEPPAVVEQVGRGRVSATRFDADPYYLALGDSLAAGVGVADLADGYVSRLHAALERAASTTYGLENLAVSGETSGTLLTGGQLDAAIAFGADNEVALITLDIGGNDLLGHLGSDDCAPGLGNPECEMRLEGALDAYAANVTAAFDRLAEAYPEATVVVLTAYNPFSFGFADQVDGFEAVANEQVARLNRVAEVAALAHGFLVADGATPMLNTVTITTHMADADPDIHPTEFGHEVLAQAILQALDAG